MVLILTKLNENGCDLLVNGLKFRVIRFHNKNSSKLWKIYRDIHTCSLFPREFLLNAKPKITRLPKFLKQISFPKMFEI